MAGPRAVADTNVWVAAAIAPGGVCGRLLGLAVEDRWQPVASPLLIQELAEVLARRKFRRWLTQNDARRFVDDLRRIVEQVEDPPPEPTLRTRDPNDEFLLALAAAAHVGALISGDPHVLEASDIGLLVIPPAPFLALLQDQS